MPIFTSGLFIPAGGGIITGYGIRHDSSSSVQITSESLVQICIGRIFEIQPVLNAMVDQRFKQALEEARRVDRIIASLQSHGPTLEELALESPLLGVPFSAKDGLRVQGNRSSPAKYSVFQLRTK